MKTTFDFQNSLWLLVNASALKLEITGGIYKGSRPNTLVDEQLEDVVINCLPVPRNQLQETIANVNIHVPNLKIEIAGKPDRSQPDNVRLNILTSMAIELVSEYVGDDFHCDFEQQLIFEEDEIYSHYSNIRVKVFSINL